MTFTEIVADVMDRLNLTSDDAATRIGRFVNHRYKWLSVEVGLNTITPAVVTAMTVIGTPYVTISGIEKIYTLYDPATTPPRVLGERTVDQMYHTPLGVDPPRLYAVVQTGATSVIVKLDCVPATSYLLGAQGDYNASTLSGSDIPPFSEKFHDLLIYGAMAEELDKMEKYDMAKKQEALFTIRMGQYRYYIAKSAYKSIYQGRNRDAPGRPGVILG